MAVKTKKAKEEKITRGFNLSRENVMALQAVAFERTLLKPKGTVSASEVLDEVVTRWRKGQAEKGRQG